MIMAMVFSTVAGRTTAANNAVKPPGKPTINRADVKNTIPDKMVPIAVSTAAAPVLWLLLNKRNRMKNRNADTGLSMMLGICPAGNAVVSAEMIPVTIPMTSTFCTRGNSRMPMNIMISIISGFMPPKKGGIME